MPMSALDQVGFVVDENLVALGRALRQLRRREFAVFGDDELAELIPKGALDSEWIPIAGDRGWVVITNDRRVRTRPVESALALRHGLRVVHLHGQVGSQRPWSQAERVLGRWRAVERGLAKKPTGPLWLSARATGVWELGYPDSGGV